MGFDYPQLAGMPKKKGWGTWQERAGDIFEFWGGVHTPMHNMIKTYFTVSFCLFLFFLANICKTSPFNIFSFKTSFPYGCSVLYEQKKITFPLIAKSRIKQAYSKEHNWVFDFSKPEKGWLGSRFLCLKRDFCEK